MTHTTKLHRKPGRMMRVFGDTLLALTCFGALQAMNNTTSAATTSAATTSATVASMATTTSSSAAKPSGSFLSVDLPNASHTQGVRETVVGDIEHATASAKSGDAALSITASTLPGFVTTVTSDDALYRKARNELLKAWSAKSTSWGNCTHAGYDCRKLSYETGDGRKGMARLFLHEDVLVVVNAVYGADEEIAKKFLASVQ